MGLSLRPIEPADAPAWDAFVRDQPNGTFFHLSAWRTVIERAFGHPTYYTVAEQDGSICGVLPLAHVRSLLFGNMLVSVPFGVYGGPLAADADTASALADHAEQLMRRTGAKAIEFRHRDPADGNWIERPELYVTFRKAIAGDDEQNLRAIPRKQRAMVRKGIRNGLVSAVDQDTDLLHRSMRRASAISARRCSPAAISGCWRRCSTTAATCSRCAIRTGRSPRY